MTPWLPCADASTISHRRVHSTGTSEPLECKLAVTYHPAFLLRDPRQKKETWKDLQMVMRYLGLTAPQRPSEAG